MMMLRVAVTFRYDILATFFHSFNRKIKISSNPFILCHCSKSYRFVISRTHISLQTTLVAREKHLRKLIDEDKKPQRSAKMLNHLPNGAINMRYFNSVDEFMHLAHIIISVSFWLKRNSNLNLMTRINHLHIYHAHAGQYTIRQSTACCFDLMK